MTNKVFKSIALAPLLTIGIFGCIEDSFDDEETLELEAEDFDPEAEPPENAGQALRAACSGNGCNNIDPATTSCPTGAYTVQTKTIYRNGTTTPIGYVELRWSPSCQTNWSRVTRTDGAYAEGMYATIKRYSNNVLVNSYTKFKSGSTQMWSNMVYAPNPPYCATATGLVDQSWTSGSATTGCY